MKKFLILFLFLTGCAGMEPPPFKSLLLNQPKVLEITPSDGSGLTDPIRFNVTFSHRIDINSLGQNSVVLTHGPLESPLLKDISELIEELESQEIPQVATFTVLDGEETHLEISPTSTLEPGIYQLIVTPSLLSVEQIPFNQKPGSKPSAFVATFSYGEDFSVDTSSSPSSPESPTPSGPSFGSAPDSLVINEILYDGLSSETDGEAFVELFGTPGADISLYQISWINGADGQETDRVTFPPGTKIPEDGLFVVADLRTNTTNATKVPAADFLDQFDPQNGPDAVLLLDRETKLVDSVVYGTGAVPQTGEGLALGEGTPAKDVAGGHSLSRISGGDTNGNSVDFVDLTAPTPGVL